MEKALDLIKQFGSRFKVGTTSEVDAAETVAGFKELGYGARYVQVGSKASAVRRGVTEYSISWWPK